MGPRVSEAIALPWLAPSGGQHPYAVVVLHHSCLPGLITCSCWLPASLFLLYKGCCCADTHSSLTWTCWAARPSRLGRTGLHWVESAMRTPSWREWAKSPPRSSSYGGADALSG